MNSIFTSEVIRFIFTFLLQITMIFGFFLFVSKLIYNQKHVAKYNFLLIGLLLILICPFINLLIKSSFFYISVKPQILQEINLQPKVSSLPPLEIKNHNIVKNDSPIKNIDETVSLQQNILVDPSVGFEETSNVINSKTESLSIPSILFITWLIGFVLFVIKTSVSYYGIRRKIFKGTPLLNREILQVVEEAIKTLRIKSNPQIIISNAAISPFVYGVLNPKIILPKILIEKYEADSFKSILFHELAHIKRGDTAKGFLQVFLQNLFWFHPLIYIYNNEMNYSREEICDNYSLNHHKPVCYASILAKIAESTLSQNKFLGISSMVSSRSELFKRVKNILNPNRTTSTNMTRFDLISVSLIFTLAILSIGTFRLIEADENSRTKESVDKVDLDLLNKKISIDLKEEFTFNEIVKMLNYTTNQKFKLHESVEALANIKQSFFIKAQNMVLSDFLNLLKAITDIDYTIVGNDVVFSSTKSKDLIDTNFQSQIFSVSQILHPKKSEKNKIVDDQLNAIDVKDLLMEKIARDSWDSSKGTSINVLDETLVVTHNKTVLKTIGTFLSEIEAATENSKKEIEKGNLILGHESSENLKSIRLELKKEISLNWKEISFEELLNDIAKTHNILSFALIQIDTAAFEKLKNDKISIRVNNQPLESVLKFIFSKYSLKFELKNGAICIVEPEYYKTLFLVERYDMTVLANKGYLSASNLSELIMEVLMPKQWSTEKGTSIVIIGNSLIITASMEMHALIKEFLIVLNNGNGKMDFPKSGK